MSYPRARPTFASRPHLEVANEVGDWDLPHSVDRYPTQTDGSSPATLGKATEGTSAAVPEVSTTGSYTVFNATPAQEVALRAQIRLMHPDILPLRVFFLPHRKYLDTARIFLLRVPAGYRSLMFTHLPSRTVFIDNDLGIYCLVRHRHPRWVRMQVGFRDLTVWSFLMASAHGAGLMVVPVLLRSNTVEAQTRIAGHNHISHTVTPLAGMLASGVHTVAYLAVTGLLAWVVYRKLGLALLRKAWVNFDLVWAAALVATGLVTLLI